MNTLSGVVQRVETRAGELDLDISERATGEEFAMLGLVAGTSVPCRRLFTSPEHAVGWSGHVVAPQLPLWPDADQLLQHLRQEHSSPMDGLFALAWYNRVTRCLDLTGDPWGIWPLYYLQADDGLLFSTSVDLLIHASPGPIHLDTGGVAAFLHFAYCLADQTLAREIRRLPQGEHLRYDDNAGAVSFESFFDYAATPASEVRSVPEAVEELQPALHRAIQRRLRHQHPYVLLLSGGLDSRAIAAVLVAEGVDFQTMTAYGDTVVMDDPDAARLAALALGLENTYVPLPVNYLEAHWKHKALLTDFATTRHTWLMPMTLRYLQADMLNMDGIAGDVIIKGSLVTAEHLELVEKGHIEELARALYQHHRLGNTLSKALSLGETWRAPLTNAIVAELERDRQHPNGPAHFILRNRTRRGIAASPCNLLAYRLHNLAPFFDLELFALAMAIPCRLKLDGSLYRTLINTIAPELSGVPTAHDKVWPENTPRRKRARMCVASPGPLTSYLDEIDRAQHRLPGLIKPEWMEKARRAAATGARERWAFLHDAQALGELSFWLSTYGDQVKVSLM